MLYHSGSEMPTRYLDRSAKSSGTSSIPASVHCDADDASVDNGASSSISLPNLSSFFGLALGWISGNEQTDSASLSEPNMPSSWSKTMTVILGTAHHAIPSNPPCGSLLAPGWIPRAFACAMDMCPAPASTSVSSSSSSSSSSSLESSSTPILACFLDCFLGLGAGTTGSSTSMSISRNHAGFVVALHTCVSALLLPHRITAKGSDAPCASPAGRFLAWYTWACSMYLTVLSASILHVSSPMRSCRASIRFSILAARASRPSSPGAFSMSSLSDSSSSCASSSSGLRDLASSFVTVDPQRLMRRSTWPTGLTCSARRDSPRLWSPMASA
mmetsp:Transcript_12751/g.51238  ORF Transcript_12751/g.51238 Transcript_12751/m.51238 type:complete len:329 (-) Transcript_12751:1840-2826(-)